ncbi:Radical SAM superfamily protein [Planctomycetes bacterium Pla163]|uniref:Radical SAM superfamily protein n=1 Tax=Rohdeia mirabilis TaxID=2528008 RepID=A0A518CZ77_9BACT|nr:Radical SAM superfamily protein [Planctomycetes bacterium Pla163]
MTTSGGESATNAAAPLPWDDAPDPWDEAEGRWLSDPPSRRPRVWRERAKSIVTRNDSPDIPFRFGANAYRGCAHACAYCYARPTHEYLDLDPDGDFEHELVVKENAAELLSLELTSSRFDGEVLCLSGATDPYQPLEASLRLTRRMLEVCLARGRAVLLFTKAALVQRDADVLARLAAGPGVQVYLSIPFADDATARALEPAAPSPSARFRAMRALTEAGVPTGLSISPVVPGLNDRQLDDLLARTAAAGGTRAFASLLRLPGPVRAIFERRLRERLPSAADRVLAALAASGADRTGRAAFGERMAGSGVRWELVRSMFETFARRHGVIADERPEPALPPVRRTRQGRLFD